MVKLILTASQLTLPHIMKSAIKTQVHNLKLQNTLHVESENLKGDGGQHRNETKLTTSTASLESETTGSILSEVGYLTD